MNDSHRPRWQKFPAHTLQQLSDAVDADDVIDYPFVAPDPVDTTHANDTLRRLFHAVDVNDSVDASVNLPDPIVLACPDETLQRCFALCLQFWEDGVSRADLLRLVGKLLRNEGLSADERLEYKNIRARYKHLRFAERLYSEKHQAGRLFDRTTITLGKLQDAFRSGQRRDILRHGLKLRLLLWWPVWSFIRRSVERTRIDNEEGVFAYQRSEMRALKKTLASDTFAGHEFHRVRKIVSMIVSYYDTLRSIEPGEHAYRMSRFLAAINGLMGAKHDEMVTEALAGRRDYDTPVPLTRDIRNRLEALVARYPI